MASSTDSLSRGPDSIHGTSANIIKDTSTRYESHCCWIVLMTLLNQLAWFPPSGAPPPYAESWLEACLSVTPATRREGSAPANGNAESRSGHGIMVPGRACSALQFSDFCCPGRQTGCLRALGHPIFRGLDIVFDVLMTHVSSARSSVSDS